MLISELLPFVKILVRSMKLELHLEYFRGICASDAGSRHIFRKIYHYLDLSYFINVKFAFSSGLYTVPLKSSSARSMKLK